MFWNFFSSTFGLVFGVLMAILTFLFVIAMVAVLPEYLEDRRKEKEKKKCPRCKEQREYRKIIRIACKYPYKKLCGDCKKKINKKADAWDDEEKDGGECEENSTITQPNSFVQITRNGKTITIINGKRVK